VPWFRLDDSFHSHPKVIAAGNEAIGLYVRCGTYAAEHLTDGFIPEHVVLLYGSPALAESLVRTKLWRRTRGGWRMPDYLDYNPAKEAVDKERKNAAERQRRSREARLSRRDSQRDSDVTHATPTRPDPNMAGVTTDPERPSTARAPNRRSSMNGVSGGLQPPPVAEAIAKALNPEGHPPQRGKHARKDDP
jgi:hypothetical protein